MVVADRAPARLQPAASGGPTLPGVRACRGIPKGAPYLSTDGVDGGPTETRHPWLHLPPDWAPTDNLRRRVYLLVKDEPR